MKKEEIIELVSLGFDPKIIQSEFGIPIETITKYIEEDKNQNNTNTQPIHHSEPEPQITTPKRETNSAEYKPTNRPYRRFDYRPIPNTQPSVSTQSQGSKSRLEIIREKYISAYKSNYTPGIHFEPHKPYIIMPSKSQEAQNNVLLEELQASLQKASEAPLNARYAIFEQEITEKALQIIGRPKTLAQSSALTTILYDATWDKMKFDRSGKIQAKLRKIRQKADSDLADLGDYLASKTDDLDELKEIYSSLAVTKSLTTHCGSIRSKIDRKIGNIRNLNVLYNMRHNIAPEVETIIQSLANGTIDLEFANEAIDKEAQKRFDSIKPGPFTLTKDRHINQVIIQIRNALAEQGSRFPIQDPDKTIHAMTELFPQSDMSQVLYIVTNNLIAQKRYEEASSLCDRYVKSYSDYNEEISSKMARDQKRKVVFSEIGHTLLERLQLQGTSREEDNRFIDSLEKQLKSKRIPLGAIPLGYNESETKKLTLADIWYNPKQKEL